MKKVYIRSYLSKNFGDDLFVKILTERYPKTKFYLFSSTRYNKKTFAKNVVKYTGFIYKVINKFLNLENIIRNNKDIMVNVGGSIFMENKSLNKIQQIYSNCPIPYYIMGANLIEYKNKQTLDTLKKLVFNRANDVCFRDLYSYQLCSELTNVRYASDIVFSLKGVFDKTIEKKVIFSVIDLDKKNNLSKYKNDYETAILKMAKHFKSMGYSITFMSFCKKEGDLLIAKKLAKLIDANVYDYDGDMDDALKEVASSSIIVGTRFHANVLGLLFNKTIIPISYDNKTDNLLKDLKYEKDIIMIKEIKKFNVDELDSYLNYKVDVSKQIKDSNNQFKNLDEILK